MSDEDVGRAKRVLERHGIKVDDMPARVVALGPAHVYVSILVEADGGRVRREMAVPFEPHLLNVEAGHNEQAAALALELLQRLSE